MAIVSKSIQHPCCPIVPTNHRVHEYWSYMIIKPTESFKKPGLEYVLTYFDNPGVVLPPAITAWVAQKQMPDFLNKLYCATVEYSKTRKLETKEDQVYGEWKKSNLRTFNNRIFFQGLVSYPWSWLWISTGSRIFLPWSRRRCLWKWKRRARWYKQKGQRFKHRYLNARMICALQQQSAVTSHRKLRKQSSMRTKLETILNLILRSEIEDHKKCF